MISLISFNPRTHTGATCNKSYSKTKSAFQSTHPYGCDTHHLRSLLRCSGFNPRTHTGATCLPCSPVRLLRRFNPRTHTGATAGKAGGVRGDAVSIHAPIRVRRMITYPSGVRFVFQSTHPYGCDCCGGYHWRYIRVSIHAPIRVRPRTHEVQ